MLPTLGFFLKNIGELRFIILRRLNTGKKTPIQHTHASYPWLTSYYYMEYLKVAFAFLRAWEPLRQNEETKRTS
jgi:hypothetical protein